MEKKKINLGEAAAEAGKGAAALFGKAKDALAKAADQTGDGTFDKEDMSVIAENVSTAAKARFQILPVFFSGFGIPTEDTASPRVRSGSRCAVTKGESANGDSFLPVTTLWEACCGCSGTSRTDS
jgi:hypothetical protein